MLLYTSSWSRRPRRWCLDVFFTSRTSRLRSSIKGKDKTRIYKKKIHIFYKLVVAHSFQRVARQALSLFHYYSVCCCHDCTLWCWYSNVRQQKSHVPVTVYTNDNLWVDAVALFLHVSSSSLSVDIYLLDIWSAPWGKGGGVGRGICPRVSADTWKFDFFFMHVCTGDFRNKVCVCVLGGFGRLQTSVSTTISLAWGRVKSRYSTGSDWSTIDFWRCERWPAFLRVLSPLMESWTKFGAALVANVQIHFFSSNSRQAERVENNQNSLSNEINTKQRKHTESTTPPQ